jgi:hypothetical protein
MPLAVDTAMMMMGEFENALKEQQVMAAEVDTGACQDEVQQRHLFDEILEEMGFPCQESAKRFLVCLWFCGDEDVSLVEQYRR